MDYDLRLKLSRELDLEKGIVETHVKHRDGLFI